MKQVGKFTQLVNAEQGAEFSPVLFLTLSPFSNGISSGGHGCGLWGASGIWVRVDSRYNFWHTTFDSRHQDFVSLLPLKQIENDLSRKGYKLVSFFLSLHIEVTAPNEKIRISFQFCCRFSSAQQILMDGALKHEALSYTLLGLKSRARCSACF